MSQQSFVTDFLNTDADLDWQGFQRSKAHAQPHAFGLENLDWSAFTDPDLEGADLQRWGAVLAGAHDASGALDSAAGLAPEPHVAADGEAVRAASEVAPLDVPLPTVPEIGQVVIGDGVGRSWTGTANSETYIDLGGNDILNGGGGVDYIYAGPGNDSVNGGDGNDRLYGDYEASAGLIAVTGGFDTINGGAGNDYLWGGLAADVLNGNENNDTVIGGDGADRLDGGIGNDSILGGTGNDIINGGPGGDIIDGGADNDSILGGAGNDTIQGNAGDDTIYAGANDDLIQSNENSSGYVAHILAEDGNDVITCTGTGIEQIDGGLGNDTISAGGGQDEFFFSGGNWGHDVIMDYSLVRSPYLELVVFEATAEFHNVGQLTISAANGGADTLVSYGDSSILFVGVKVSDHIEEDFAFTARP